MTILDKILKTKREELDVARRLRPFDEIRKAAEAADPPRDFASSLMKSRGEPIRVIAEIKKASPSAGLIVPDFDAMQIARTYAANGASALSVLTDETYFQGHLNNIRLVKEKVSLPVLRKDFTIDEYQVFETRAAGADAILLIVEAIGIQQVVGLHRIAQGLGLAVIVEVHTRDNLVATLDSLGAPKGSNYFLGINNRDLGAQKTSTDNAIELSPLLGNEPGAWIAESGIKTRLDVQSAEQAGACAVLVGESMLRAADVGKKLRELRGDL